MAHHVHHQHKAPLEARGAYVVETVVNYVYVTAGPDDAVSSAEPSATHRQNGSPIQHTREPEAVSSAPASPSYHAPARQQNPSHTAVLQASSSAPFEVAGVTPSAAAKQHTTFATSSGLAFSATGASATGFATAFNSAAPIATSGAQASKSDNGLSGGAKAGIAFGVILGLALIAGIAFFLIRRKQKSNEDHQRLDDEKTDLNKRTQSMVSHATAPRLSLRPVTQLFSPEQMSEKQGAGAVVAGLATNNRSISPESAPENPFGDDAEDKSVIATPVAAAAPTPVTPKINNASEQSPRGESSAFPAAVAGSKRNSPPGPGQNNVHRVHMDFKPSMDDELELRAGSLVRMLHEYDDGWALCIRLDRSQQGVVPRTCISKLPVKPRPAPPPGAARGPPPQGRPRNGSSASGSSGPRMSPAPRPMPPQGARYRSQTNGPRRPESPAFPQEGGRQRANSDAMSSRRMTPPSPMNSSPTSSAPSSPPQVHVAARKPVPGQAM